MRPATLLVLTLLACGPLPVDVALRVTVLSGAAAEGDGLPQEELDAGGPVSALGVSSAGDLVAVAGGRVLERAGGELVYRRQYADGAEATSLGTVDAIVPRLKGGAWLLSTEGLFALDGQYVTRSPVLAGMGALHGGSEISQGALNGLWLAAADGVYRRQTDSTVRYRVEGYGDQATEVAVVPTGAAAFAVLGEALVLLTPQDGTLVAAAPPEETGRVSAVVAAPSALYAATERGLYRWQLDAAPQWARFAVEGARGVQVDPVTGTAWVSVPGALLQVDGDAVTRFALPDSTVPLAVDRFGDVWLGRGSSLVRLKAGAASGTTGFAADLKPWLAERCHACHADFADVAVFSPKAEAALQRVRQGDMPRCAGGVPCPAEQHLKTAEYAALEAWIRGGKQP